jgi:hypothetical protein
MHDYIGEYRFALGVVPTDSVPGEFESFDLFQVSVVFTIDIPFWKPLLQMQRKPIRNCPLVEVQFKKILVGLVEIGYSIG